jgi:NAD(P)-dependent dehydrogenase (short-subunit alcohol dehydrogenase family)
VSPSSTAAAPPIRLDGRAAIVTGAGRGLGRAHAIELARRGAAVLVNDPGVARGGEADAGRGPADDVVGEIRAAGGRAEASYHDVSDSVAAKAMVAAACDAFGRLDILVTNAGINRLSPFGDCKTDDFAAIVGVHLFGTFHAARPAYDVMKAAGYGRIIMTTSQIAWCGKADSPAYGAAKGGILGLLATMHLTAPADGITVNAVAPFAFTRAAEGVFPDALRPLLDPAQVSALVAFLACEGCSLNGEVLIAGGGHFAAAETRESVGIDIDDPAEITAERLAQEIGAMTDMTGAIRYTDAMEAVGVTFARLKQRAGLD